MIVRGRADDKPEIIDRRIREFRDEAALLVWLGRPDERCTGELRGEDNAEVSTQIVAGLEDAWSKQASAK